DQVEVTDAGQSLQLEVFAAALVAAAVDFRSPHRKRVGDGDVTRNQSGERDDQRLFLPGVGVDDGPGEERIAAGIRRKEGILVGQGQIKAAGFEGKMVVAVQPDAASNLEAGDQVEVDLVVAGQNGGAGLAEGAGDGVAAEPAHADETGCQQW